MSKIDELLAVLELRDEPKTPEEIQFQSSPLKVWVSQNLFDDPDERNAFYKGHISLADLAFRLRPKPSKEYHDALVKVYDYLWMNGKVSCDYTHWLEFHITAIDRIIAALIAKESNG